MCCHIYYLINIFSKKKCKVIHLRLLPVKWCNIIVLFPWLLKFFQIIHLRIWELPNNCRTHILKTVCGKIVFWSLFSFNESHYPVPLYRESNRGSIVTWISFCLWFLQVLQYLSLIHILCKLLAISCVRRSRTNDIIMSSISTVSYTHLDVYKRQ